MKNYVKPFKKSICSISNRKEPINIKYNNDIMARHLPKDKPYMPDFSFALLR